jgi:hypothetical protein
MPSKHHAKRHHRKGANNKKTVKKQARRHRRSQKKQTGGSTGCGKQTGGSPASRAVMDFANTSGPALDDYAVGMELPSMDKITKCATQQMGGSLVSDAVMSAKMGMTDYQEQANLPAMSQLGGAGCGANPKQAGGAGSCGSPTPENLLGNGNLGQKGGSPASDRLDSFTQVYNTSTLNEKKGDVITPDMISGGAEPNLYQLTGGKGRRGTKKLMSKQRGGNFLGLAGCGPWNGTDAGRKYADFFTKTSKCPGPEWYANPPELPKAGSGDAADLATGATYPFA